MDALYRFRQSLGVSYGPSGFLFNESVDQVSLTDFVFTEGDGGSSVSTLEHTLIWKELHAWLDSHPLIKSGTDAERGVIRVFWIPCLLARGYGEFQAPQQPLLALIVKLGLQTVLERLTTSERANFFDCSKSHQYGLSSPYAYEAIASIQDETTKCTHVVCWIRHPDQGDLTKAIASFRGSTLEHPLAMAVAWAMRLNHTFISLEVAELKLLDIEGFTGYHPFEDRLKPATESTDDLRSWSKSATELKATVAIKRMISSITQQRLRATSEALEAQRTVASSTHQSLQTEDLQLIVRKLLKETDDVGFRIESLATRLDAQLTAIFHLITQEDTKRSIQLAESSTALAADSRALAEAATRDAKAMKTLAVVTMVYLPPTAIATIFAMPFFDWNRPSSRVIVGHSFWVYWATAVPLTLATLLVWWYWVNRRDDFKTVMERIEQRIKKENGDIDPKQGVGSGTVSKQVVLPAERPASFYPSPESLMSRSWDAGDSVV